MKINNFAKALKREFKRLKWNVKIVEHGDCKNSYLNLTRKYRSVIIKGWLFKKEVWKTFYKSFRISEEWIKGQPKRTSIEIIIRNLKHKIK